MINNRCGRCERYMPFGKHHGKELRTIPRRYLLWVLRTCKIDAQLDADIRAALKKEEYPLTRDEQVEKLFSGGNNENKRSGITEGVRPSFCE